ncbi:HK97-gp10 family putative phage morphogenesis protein [Thioclava sp. GXIMD2076]|uniref:HK97-gp10 family putative phage morphogenesis protein n=1 Tax=Thioclava sp. GXIMD2076 TaxID=3131931 RepID=UPI0030D34281
MAQLSPRITAKLKRIPAVAVDAAREAMEEGADIIVAEMRKLAPKGATGRLALSIGWTWGDLPAGTFMIDEVRSGGNKGDQYATLRLRFYAGSREAFYARFQEFGTRDMPAQPFFYPAWRAKRAEFRRLIRKRVRDAIKKEFSRG